MKSSQGLYSHKTVQKCWGERQFCHAALCHEKGALCQTSGRSAINSKGFAPEFLNFVSFLHAWVLPSSIFKLPVWKACRASKCRTSPEENNKKNMVYSSHIMPMPIFVRFSGGYHSSLCTNQIQSQEGKQRSFKPAASSPVNVRSLSGSTWKFFFLEKSNNN